MLFRSVESVALIDQDALDSLATWLCQTNEYHDVIERSRTLKISDCEFERQVKANGYCNHCRDFAGELLSHFDIVKNPEADNANS